MDKNKVYTIKGKLLKKGKNDDFQFKESIPEKKK